MQREEEIRIGKDLGVGAERFSRQVEQGGGEDGSSSVSGGAG